ncbi:hypothetical protein [Ramlibacter albus]|uniref:Uncharacterized protein n=1 Tax=Ramlibacter albus TaxID=2079448 RepID=A0A923MAF9_9BURK|nr:hypothetical protein [Ramlibacter albus]MBC5765734.1 hypothetical protein [Ramlibacter albus]
MATSSSPQPLAPEAEGATRGNISSTWLILAAAVAFVAIAQISLGGSSETRECKREAQENASVARAMGGEERFIEMCMELQKKVREVSQRR